MVGTPASVTPSAPLLSADRRGSEVTALYPGVRDRDDARVSSLARPCCRMLGDTQGTQLSARTAAPRGLEPNHAGLNTRHARCSPRVPRPRKVPIYRHFRCRRRDSNLRHADYDSAAPWLYSAV